MDLKEYILPTDSIIGGWYIPSNICDEFIKLFKDNEEHHAPGVLGPPLRIDPTEKKSTEVAIHPQYDHPSFQNIKNI